MNEQTLKQQAEMIVEKIKDFVKDGNASRIILKRKGLTLMNISLNAGIIGTVVGMHTAPFLVLTTALVSFGLDCEIEIEKKDGSVVNLSQTPVGMKLEELKQTAKSSIASAAKPADIEIDPDEE